MRVCKLHWRYIMHKCFKVIPDLLEYVASGETVLVPLRENSKQPLYKEWNTRDYALNDIVDYLYNMGILITPGIGVVDIDGSEGTNPETKKDSRAVLGKMLIEEFKDEALIVETANYGFHIYFRYDKGFEIEDAHALSQSFQYSDTFPVEELRNAHLGNAIEIFAKGTKNRQLL